MAVVRIQLRRDTASNWTSANPVLAAGEIGIETDTDQFKIGDGTTAWSSLGYGGIQGPAGTDGVDSVASATAPITYDAGTQTVGIDQTGISITASQLSDITATATELNYVNGVTSAIQDQLNNPTAIVVTDATTSRTLTSSDAGKTIVFTSASDITITVDASTDFEVGERLDFVQDGTGIITVTASSATVAAAETSTTSGSFTIGAQYSAATLLCVGTDSYRLIGNITAV